MERGLLMLSLRLMLTPTSCMEDTMDSDMDTTDTLMLIMARGLLMLSLRLMLTLIFSMVVTPTTDKLSTKEKEVPAAKETNSHPNLLQKCKSVSVLELISLVAGKIENLPNKSKFHHKK